MYVCDYISSRGAARGARRPGAARLAHDAGFEGLPGDGR